MVWLNLLQEQFWGLCSTTVRTWWNSWVWPVIQSFSKCSTCLFIRNCRSAQESTHNALTYRIKQSSWASLVRLLQSSQKLLPPSQKALSKEKWFTTLLLSQSQSNSEPKEKPAAKCFKTFQFTSKNVCPCATATSALMPCHTSRT